MRRLLTTFLAATAIAAPSAAATTDRPDTDGPRGRTHAGQRDSQDGDRAAAPARDAARADRPRIERPSGGESARQPGFTPRGTEAPAPAATDRPRRQEQEAVTPRVSEGHAVSRRQPGFIPHRSGESLATSVPHRDRSDGAFNRPPTSAGRHEGEHRQWTRDWRTDRRYDWRAYRERNRSAFRIGFYSDPYGFAYRRWNIGWSMRPNYYRSAFWINDPWQYRLPEVYGPYRWVRYYDDAILVDTWSGEVVDVIYNFFW